MPDFGLLLNPGSGGETLDTWKDPVSGRVAQKMVPTDSRGGILFRSSSGLITATAVASQQLWSFFNPTGSGKTAYVHEINFIGFNSAAAALIPVRLVRTTSTAPSGGGVLTAVRPDGGTVNNVVIPRLGGSGFLMTALVASGGNIGSAILPLTAGATYPAPLYVDRGDMSRDLIVPPGSGILLDAIGTPNAAHRLTVDVTWEELA